VLAHKGNGNFAYLDNEKEGEKVLVKELTQTLFASADDVYMNVSFNPELVKSYRLIGFDNKRAALADTSSVLEGGELGSGHSVIAIFELAPTAENLKAMESGSMDKSIATTSIHYKLPGTKESRHAVFKSPYNYLELKESRPFIRFAAAVTLFGSLLRKSDHVRKAGWPELVTLTQESIDASDPLQKEFLDLVLKAQKLYAPAKKKIF
jgi:Ca-activated chloride channel family protein